MTARIHGTLNGADASDTYRFWRRVGNYRYEIRAQGLGTVAVVLEVLDPSATGPEGEVWRLLEEHKVVAGGTHASGVVAVQVPSGDPASTLEWVQIRLRISRPDRSKAVEYSVRMEPGT